MSVVCPTVLAESVEDYKAQVERVAGFAKRVHLDAADGVFAPTRTIAISDMWRPEGAEVNLHIMYQEPHKYVDDFLKLKPDLVIVHAECGSDLKALADTVHQAGAKFGIALLAPTPAEKVKPYLEEADHVLLFAGTLGSHGGVADFSVLDKAKELKSWKPSLEIGWDGGVNDQNAKQLAEGGVDVLNAGGFIQHAPDPDAAYEALVQSASSS